MGVASILAAAIKKLGDVDLVLFGQSSIDAQTGMTPAAVARRLGFGALTFVAKIRELDPAGKKDHGRAAAGRRQAGRLVQVARVRQRGQGHNAPRYASFMGIRKAAKAAIPTWSAADLGLDAASLAPRVDWARTYAPPPREGACEMVTGDTPQVIAAALADKIMAEKIL